MKMPSTPYAQGVVVDSDTSLPISSVTVVWEQYPETKTETNKDGHFTIGKSSWRMVPVVPIEYVPDIGKLTFSKPGYKSTVKENFEHWRQVDLVVQLTRIQ